MSDKIDNVDEIDEMLSYGQGNGVPVNKLSSEHAIKTYQPTARAREHSPWKSRRLLQVHCSLGKAHNPYSLCIMNIPRVNLTCSQSADERKTSLWSKITVSELIDSFTKAVSGFVLKFRHLTSGVQDLANRLVCVTDTEDSGEESRLIFYLLNLCLYVSLVVLSPDKAIQALSSAQPAYPVISWFQDAIEVLRKLMPL